MVIINDRATKFVMIVTGEHNTTTGLDKVHIMIRHIGKTT